ncbi:MAG: HDOD domain-containing protein, partial [Calditerrivibrio sp.]|nr:HDOD domain-containing protein [Calditerrivibrio sp.]
MNNSKLKDLLGDVKELPPMPQVAVQVMGILDKDDFSFAELVSVISKDVSITASILKIANSPLFGSRVTINNLTQAISLLGIKNLKNIVVALSTRGMFESNKITIFEQKLWEHSVATAVYARIFALKFNRKMAEEAFIIALLHDIGQIVLSLFVEKYNNVKENVFGQHIDISLVEDEFIGVNHCLVGSLLLEEWGLPEIYCDVVLNHHNFQNSKYLDMAKIIYIANNKVKDHQFSISKKKDYSFDGLLSDMGYEQSEIEEVDISFMEIIKSEKDLLN